MRNARVDTILALIDAALDESGTPEGGRAATRPSFPDTRVGGFGIR